MDTLTHTQCAILSHIKQNGSSVTALGLSKIIFEVGTKNWNEAYTPLHTNGLLYAAPGSNIIKLTQKGYNAIGGRRLN